MKQHCRLCPQDRVLRRSHIVPEFVYRPVFGTNHTAMVVEPKKPRRRYRQTGFWDRLFCDDCEGKLCQLETYFADVWFKKPLRPSRLEGLEVTLSGLDYPKFKLFLLSILWRAELSTREELRDVSLGQHAEDIRRRILGADPGPADLYPISGLALRSESHGFKDDLMLLPEGTRIEGHYVCIMLFGGVFWLCTSSHREDWPALANLREDGTLTLLVQNWMENSTISDLSRQMKKHFGTSLVSHELTVGNSREVL